MLSLFVVVTMNQSQGLYPFSEPRTMSFVLHWIDDWFVFNQAGLEFRDYVSFRKHIELFYFQELGRRLESKWDALFKSNSEQKEKI